MIRLFGSGKISEKYMKITISRLKELIKEELNEARGWGADDDWSLRHRYASGNPPVAGGVGDSMTDERKALLQALEKNGMTFNKDHEKTLSDDQLRELLRVMTGSEKPNLEEKLTKADKKRKKELEKELDSIQHK